MTQQLEGFRELEKKLDRLSHLNQGRALRVALNASANPVVKQARATVPRGDVPHKTYKGRWVSPGFASRNIRKKVWIARNKTYGSAMVGVRSEAFYALQFLELGTSEIPRRPWLEPAFRLTRGSQTSLFAQKMREYIAKVAK